MGRGERAEQVTWSPVHSKRGLSAWCCSAVIEVLPGDIQALSLKKVASDRGLDGQPADRAPRMPGVQS